MSTNRADLIHQFLFSHRERERLRKQLVEENDKLKEIDDAIRADEALNEQMLGAGVRIDDNMLLKRNAGEGERLTLQENPSPMYPFELDTKLAQAGGDHDE